MFDPELRALVEPFQDEFNAFFLGREIGEGVYRRVFANPSEPDTSVIKVEKNIYARMFSNVLEWNVWDELRDHPEASKWLAPCVGISRSGNVLVQKRTEPIRESEIPTEVPSFLWDAHGGNWGMFEGRPVVYDYAFTSLVKVPKRLKMIPRSKVGTNC